MYLEGTLYAFKEERDLMPTYRCEWDLYPKVWA
jgi:hypothetical protein